MKKKLVIAVIITGLGLAGLNQAFAGWGARGGYCPNYPGLAFSQQDPAVQEKLKTFFSENQELRKTMVMKRAERQALMRGDNPDPAAVSKVAGELFDLHTTMRQRAEEAGVAPFLGPMVGSGYGPGKCGSGMRGPGKGGRGMGGQMMGGPGTGGGPRF